MSFEHAMSVGSFRSIVHKRRIIMLKRIGLVLLLLGTTQVSHAAKGYCQRVTEYFENGDSADSIICYDNDGNVTLICRDGLCN